MSSLPRVSVNSLYPTTLLHLYNSLAPCLPNQLSFCCRIVSCFQRLTLFDMYFTKIIFAVFFCTLTFASYLPVDLSSALSYRQSSADCNVSSTWSNTYDAYNKSHADSNFLSWWAKNVKEGERLDQVLGREFGANNFQCGIGTETQCSIPDCFSLQDNNQPAWMWHIASSFVNLHAFLEVLSDALNIGTEQAQELVPGIINDIYDPAQPNSMNGEIAGIIGAAVSFIASFVSDVVPLPWVRIITKVVGLFSNAIAGDIALALNPNANGDAAQQDYIDLEHVIYNSSTTARHSIAALSDQLFAGKNDSSGRNISSYIANGRFVNPTSIPDTIAAEDFYKTMIVSGLLNLWLKQQQIYILSTTANISFPPEDLPIWQSSATNRTYAPYMFNSGKVQELPELDVFADSYYNISVMQILTSSARSWEYGNENITASNVSQILQSNASFNPWTEQAAWPGVFTLPTADGQDHEEYLVSYGSTTLPCCVGIECQDTRNFTAQAHVDGAKKWKKQCKKQMKGQSPNYDDVYGSG